MTILQIKKLYFAFDRMTISWSNFIERHCVTIPPELFIQSNKILIFFSSNLVSSIE